MEGLNKYRALVSLNRQPTSRIKTTDIKIEDIRLRVPIKNTTKIKDNEFYSNKKEILFSIERNKTFDTIIKNELFIKFSDIGFSSKNKLRHYKCQLFQKILCLLYI